MSAEAAPKTGTIHDQGYQRYEGTRLPQSRRFLVIARNVIAVAWKARWGVKLPVLGTVLTLVITAGILVVAAKVQAATHGHGLSMFRTAKIFVNARMFFAAWGVVLTTTVVIGSLADDLRSGAFQFYFSRPLRPQDYVRGKLLGLFGVVGAASFAGPFLLGVLRVCLADDLAQAQTYLPVIGQAFLVGAIGTAALVLPAAGLAALMRQRIAGQAAFIVYWVVVSRICVELSYGLRVPPLALLSLSNDIDVVARALFGAEQELRAPEPWQAALVIVAAAAAGYVSLRQRIRSASTAGIGGV